MADDILRPKVSAPGLSGISDKRRGMFVNPPGYAEMGGFSSAGKLERGNKGIMGMEKGGPQAKKGKPL